MYVSEYVMAKYPEIPADVVQSIVEAYIGQNSLASVGKQLGVQFVMRWKLTNEADSVGPPSVRSWIVNALIGAHYLENGPLETKKWISQHILSRAVDVDAHLDLHVKLGKPRQMLSFLTKSLNKPSPVARYLLIFI